jgi:MFS family permease
VEQVGHPHVPLWVIVAIACVAQFMVVLDTSIVNVALPAMKAGLGLSTTDQQWVVDGYLITFGGFLLFAARAGDLFGRKWVFQAGLVVFTAASLAGGLAQGPALLLGARLVQGVGAAALAPSSLSLITASHPEGAARAKALSVWAATASSAGAVGLVPSPTRADWGRLDVPGAVTVTAAISALVYGVSEATGKGWGSTQVLAALAAAVLLLAAFGVIETRSAQPLVPFGIFRHRSLSVANVVMACVGVAMTASLFFVSLYLQEVLGYSAVRTGLAMVPMTAMLVIGSLFVARRLIPRVGVRSLLVIGRVLAAAGLTWLSRFPDHSAYAAHILGPTALTGAGMGLMVLPLTVAATGGLEPRFAGLASGLLNMGRQIGGAIGLAVLVTVAAATSSHSHLSSATAATVQGYRVAVLVCAAVAMASALIALLLPTPAKLATAATGAERAQAAPPPATK